MRLIHGHCIYEIETHVLRYGFKYDLFAITKNVDLASYLTYWCFSFFVENMERKAHEAHNIPHK